MNEPRKRPGPLWFFFYGRRRSGFPWLLLGVFLAVLVPALLFAIPGAADTSRTIAVFAVALLLGGGAIAAVVAAVFPRRRR